MEKIAPRVPAFEEVRAAVTAEARAAAVSDALMAKAKAVREAGRRAGAKFVEAAKGLGLKPVVTPEFTLSKGLGDDPHSDLLMPAVISCNAGEFTDILPAGEGVLIVARLAQRRPADPALLPSLRPEPCSSRRTSRIPPSRARRTTRTTGPDASGRMRSGRRPGTGRVRRRNGACRLDPGAAVPY